MKKFNNEIYALVDEDFMSKFTGLHLNFMKDYYYKFYAEFCRRIKRTPLSSEEFYSNMHRRRIKIYQLCCPYCGSIYVMIHDRKIQGKGGYNYCPHCGRASAVENILRQVSRFIRINGINRLGLKEFKKEHQEVEEWLLAYDCYQMEIVSLASIIEVVFREYFEALLFINNLGVTNDYVKKVVQKQTGNDFMNIEKANDIFKKAYGIDIRSALEKTVWTDLIDVVNLRNMMVHNNGRVDARFKKMDTYARNKDKVVGELYKLEDSDIARYLQSVITAVEIITNLFLQKYYESRGKVIANHYFNDDGVALLFEKCDSLKTTEK